MYLLADHRTSHAAGRTGVPEEPAEGETSGHGEVCRPSPEIEEVLVPRDVIGFMIAFCR